MEKRRFNELPEEDQLALLDLFVDQGILDTQGFVTPLGEEYILSGYVGDETRDGDEEGS